MGNTNFDTQIKCNFVWKKDFMLLTNYPTNLIAHNYILQYVYSDNKFVRSGPTATNDTATTTFQR
jgi:hypothetical protein